MKGLSSHSESILAPWEYLILEPTPVVVNTTVRLESNKKEVEKTSNIPDANLMGSCFRGSGGETDKNFGDFYMVKEGFLRNSNKKRIYYRHMQQHG